MYSEIEQNPGFFGQLPHFAVDNREIVEPLARAISLVRLHSFPYSAVEEPAREIAGRALPSGPRISHPIFKLFLALLVLIPPVSAQQSPPREVSVRTCALRGQETDVTKKPSKQAKKNGKQAAASSTTACLELRFATLEVQEYLQSFVREQKWRVSGEEIGESFWSFSIGLRKEELLEYVKPDSATDRMQWTGGKAVVMVRTAELSDGFTRTTVSAHFEGFGASEDAFAVKRSSLPLASNGTLEIFLVGALETHFRSKH